VYVCTWLCTECYMLYVYSTTSLRLQLGNTACCSTGRALNAGPALLRAVQNTNHGRKFVFVYTIVFREEHERRLPLYCPWSVSAVTGDGDQRQQQQQPRSSWSARFAEGLCGLATHLHILPRLRCVELCLHNSHAVLSTGAVCGEQC
jgi:hypothetical protein